MTKADECCEWMWDIYNNEWITSCGHINTLDSMIRAIDFEFCPYCGLILNI